MQIGCPLGTEPAEFGGFLSAQGQNHLAVGGGAAAEIAVFHIIRIGESPEEIAALCQKQDAVLSVRQKRSAEKTKDGIKKDRRLKVTQKAVELLFRQFREQKKLAGRRGCFLILFQDTFHSTMDFGYDFRHDGTFLVVKGGSGSARKVL